MEQTLIQWFVSCVFEHDIYFVGVHLAKLWYHLCRYLGMHVTNKWGFSTKIMNIHDIQKSGPKSNDRCKKQYYNIYIYIYIYILAKGAFK